MTVITPKSYYHHKTEGNDTNPVLEENILISFRTFEENGILLYAFDNYNNFVQLHFSDKKVYFTFNSDRTINQLHIDVDHVSEGTLVQVKVERQLQRTSLFVNDKNVTADVVIRFVDKYFRMPWHQGKDLESVFPPRGTYRTIDHSEMFVGHVGGGTETGLGGFTGCIQGFVVGEELFDLVLAATTDETSGDLAAGCVMICDSKPCQNQGLCIEHWKKNVTSCDCSLTSYTGESCQKDIGGNFDGDTTLKYVFDEENITEEMESNVAVRLAFSTDIVSSSQLLLLIQFNERKYILFGLTEDNTLYVEEKINENIVKRRAMSPESNNWSNNYRHWFYYTRKSGVVTLIVDGETYFPSIQIVDNLTESFEGQSNVVYIAGLSEDINQGLHANFRGCISNVMIEFGDSKLMPLETAFGYKKGSLDKIRVKGTMNERKCAAFAELSHLTATLPSNIPPEIHGPDWFPEPPATGEYRSKFDDMDANPLESITRASNRVAAVMGVLLIIVVLALMFYIYRIQRRYRRERMGDEYHVYKKGRRRTLSAKAVSFNHDEDEADDYEGGGTQPLVHFPDSPPVYTPSATAYNKKISFRPLDESNGRDPRISHNVPLEVIEMTPLRTTSSQELEWDPAGAQLHLNAMDHMNPEETANREEDTDETEEEDGPLPELKYQFAPLASASEVTINRLSQTFT